MPDEPKYFGENLPYLKPFQKKGKLIAIEGTDGCGRSTQVELLKNWLEVRGYAVVDLHMGQDLFDSFVNYQSALIGEYNKLSKEFNFQTVDATKTVDEIQKDIREIVKPILAEKPKAKK